MQPKVFVVTGSNKGIGYGIVRGLAEKVKGGIIYLTARSLTLGEEALSKVQNELGSKKQSEIQLHQLDITDENSCKNFAAHLKKEHGGIDVLINNAGFAFKSAATESAEEQAKITIDINYYGTKTASKHLVPLIRPGGRVVNVCSQAGIMVNTYSPEWINKFKTVNYTEADIDHFVEEYKKAAKEGNRRERGFPESAYRVSKAAEIAYTLLQNAELKSKSIIANACCPGYVDTDMTSHKGPLTITEGADTPIYLATDPNVPDGKFVYLRKVTEWI
ncbi:short chain dehydrogenase domain-containing protein [Ditylenchus destructor]|uniref:carbonyl reductase (NADPH) n=1 Tax=Ditylenchus destructor TaxID=166010 RepID=A0AAD4NEC2_9BILA|nr:short chain dehydrogenase domain-containing protein [Ditylenchus destructor]